VLTLNEAMNKKMIGMVGNHKKNLDVIRWHLTEQFNLPMEQVDMMLPSFIATLGSHMCNLENALAENNLVLLSKVGHTIKGAFLNLGMQDCAVIALSIEEKGRQGDSLADFKKMIEELRLLIQPILE